MEYNSPVIAQWLQIYNIIITKNPLGGGFKDFRITSGTKT
jgi:hypothetical protein